MSMVIKKRQLVMVTLIIALGSAVFINWYYTNPHSDIAANDTAEVTDYTDSAESLGEALYVNKSEDSVQEYFSEAELMRSEAHDEAAEILNGIISENSSEDAVNDARKQLSELSSLIKTEADVQALITAKTGSRCVVTLNNSTAQIVVEKGVLDDSISLQIKEIVLNQTNISGENITIIELNS